MANRCCRLGVMHLEIALTAWPRQLAPGCFEQVGHAGPRDARDSEEREPQFRRAALQRLHPTFVVDRIDLVRGDDLRFCRECRLKQFELAAHGFEILDGIASGGTRDIDEMNQHSGTLEVTKKLMAQAEAAMRSFNKSRYVRHNKTSIAAKGDDSQIRRQRREWIIGNLRPGGGDAGDQCRLAGLWKTPQPHSPTQLQLSPKQLFLARLPGLHFPWGSIGGRY